MPGQPHTRTLAVAVLLVGLVAVLLVGLGRALGSRTTSGTFTVPKRAGGCNRGWTVSWLSRKSKERKRKPTRGAPALQSLTPTPVVSRRGMLPWLSRKKRKEKEADARSPSLAEPGMLLLF